jgi:hypothetical protein
MKRLFIAALLVLMSVSLFAQWSKNGTDTTDESLLYLGVDDVWTFNPDRNVVVDEEGFLWISFILDFDKTNWNNFDPDYEGLLGTGIVFRFDTNDPDYMGVGFSYLSEYPLRLGGWFFLMNEEGDLTLVGGQPSREDTSYTDRTGPNNYLAAIEINVTDDVRDFFLANEEEYWIAVMEFEYGDHLTFNLPIEMFELIREIRDEYL